MKTLLWWKEIIISHQVLFIWNIFYQVIRIQCHWKGEASYYHVVVGGERNDDAAWYYPEPSDAAQNIKGYVAFWKGVKITPA